MVSEQELYDFVDREVRLDELFGQVESTFAEPLTVPIEDSVEMVDLTEDLGMISEAQYQDLGPLEQLKVNMSRSKSKSI